MGKFDHSRHVISRTHLAEEVLYDKGKGEREDKDSFKMCVLRRDFHDTIPCALV